MAPNESTERDVDGHQEGLERRVTELETRVRTLVEENQRLREENEQLQRLREENEQLQGKVEEQAEVIVHLRARLKWYENAHTPPSKLLPGGLGGAATETGESGPDADGDTNSGESGDDAGDEGEGAEDDTETETDERSGTSASADEEDEDEGPKTPGRSEGHEGTTRTLPDPDRTVQVDECYCLECGRKHTDPEEYEEHTVLDIPYPIPVEVIKFELGMFECSCGNNVSAEHPDCPEEGDYGPGLLTLNTILRYHCRLTHRKQAELYEWLLDHEISHSSIYNLTGRVAEQLRPGYEEVNAQLRERDVINIDETGFPVDGDQHWLWAFVTAEEVFYRLADTRGSQVLEEVLGEDFDEDAIIGADGWSAYPSFHALLQRCWAHLLREAKFVAERHDEAVELCEELHDLFEELKEFNDRDPSDVAREAKRDLAYRRLEELVTAEYSEKEVQKLATKLENGLGFWLTFVTHPEVDPTNNCAERAIRYQVILRKIFGGLRSERGVFIHETNTTMMATWEQRGLDPPEELLSILGGRGLAAQAAEAEAAAAARGEASPEPTAKGTQAVEVSS